MSSSSPDADDDRNPTSGSLLVGHVMSMAAKVAALREFFGVDEADLRAAISKMNQEQGPCTIS